MKLIYIEVNAEEIRENKTLAKSIADAIIGFCDAIVDFEPVLKGEYKFKSEDSDE